MRVKTAKADYRTHTWRRGRWESPSPFFTGGSGWALRPHMVGSSARGSGDRPTLTPARKNGEGKSRLYFKTQDMWTRQRSSSMPRRGLSRCRPAGRRVLRIGARRRRRRLPAGTSTFRRTARATPGHGSVAAGHAIFDEKCSACHGAHGEGKRWTAGRRLRHGFRRQVERTVGSFWPYATTLFDFVRRAMRSMRHSR